MAASEFIEIPKQELTRKGILPLSGRRNKDTRFGGEGLEAIHETLQEPGYRGLVGRRGDDNSISHPGPYGFVIFSAGALLPVRGQTAALTGQRLPGQSLIAARVISCREKG